MEALVSKKPPPQDANGHRPSRSSAASKALITRNLKLIYGETAAEPLPKNLLDLLNQIDDQDKTS